jgi:hypothetical protein
MRYFITKLRMEPGCTIKYFLKHAESHMNDVANLRSAAEPPTTIRLVSVTRDWGHMLFFWEEEPT